MSKGPDYKKQTSTLSAKQVFEDLKSAGFVVGTYDNVPEVKKAYGRDVMAARRRFGDNAAISITGRSVTMVGSHAKTGQKVEVLMPLDNMIGHGALVAIQQKTGLTFENV